MFKQIINWYKSRKPFIRLILIIVCWSLFWIMIEFLDILIWPDEVQDSVIENILSGIFTGILLTCFGSCKLTKKVFTKNRPAEKSTRIAEAINRKLPDNYSTCIPIKAL